MKEHSESKTFIIPGGPIYEFAKRCVDILGASCGLLVLSPVIALISIFLKLSSPGPIFYRGVRIGQFGRPFKIFKFRTMVAGADKGAGTTSRNDLRITKKGKFLRRYKLDELPQFFNVLIGEMSFVGPRPELARYAMRYKGLEHCILQVKPGITDYSSIAFISLNELISDNDPDVFFEKNILTKKNALRIQYVQERSFIRDMNIIAKTISRIAKDAFRCHNP